MDNSKLVSDLSGILEGLDSSQEQLEKDAFDVINSSDTSLNLVKESISSVEEILKMITELNEIAEESSARIAEVNKVNQKCIAKHRSPRYNKAQTKARGRMRACLKRSVMSKLCSC